MTKAELIAALERVIYTDYTCDDLHTTATENDDEWRELLQDIVRKAKAEDMADEPLAVLADRKCYGIETSKGGYSFWEVELISLHKDVEYKYFQSDTYASAEAKARAFLLSLQDREGE